MPVFPCKHPTCTEFVRSRGDYCDRHEEEGRQDRTTRDRYYDRHLRNPDAKVFYNSAAWGRARGLKLANEPVCERCRRQWAQHVHHRTPLAQCTQEERTKQENLMSVCPPCHNEIEAEAAQEAAHVA